MEEEGQNEARSQSFATQLLFLNFLFLPETDRSHRRKIRLKEGNGKCRHLKKLTCKRNFAAGIYLSEAQNPPHTLYTCIQYTYSPKEGGKGRVEPQRRLEGQLFTKLGL
jgi:hypothetical protein